MKRISPKGIVLPILLMVLLVITILSVEFPCRCDLELACSRNMLLRMQMDSLAESGLEHARGLALNPQECPQEYWRGAVGQQLIAGSSDFYDVNVVKLGECNYQIISTAYRLDGRERTGRTGRQAELRLDPCIGYWQGRSATIPLQTRILGDVYCGGSLTVNGTIDGDVFAAGAIGGPAYVTGHRYELVQAAPVCRPDLSPADFQPYYYINHDCHQVRLISTEVLRDVQLRPVSTNPAGVCYRPGDLRVHGSIEIEGTLVVEQDLILEGDCRMVVRSVKNFPALLVGHDITMAADHQHLRIEGLGQIGRDIHMGNGTGNTLEVIGMLCLIEGTVEQTNGGGLKIVAAPDKAALLLWKTSDALNRWSSAGGAFFKSIQRY